MDETTNYEPKLRLIRVGSKLPTIFALMGIVVVGVEAFVGVLGYTFNVVATCFVVSLIWYFRLKCPRCGKAFVPFMPINTFRWLNPKACHSCQLPIEGES